jgi:hypothetical protein
VLVLAAAAGLARVEVRKDTDGFTVRTGVSSVSAPTSADALARVSYGGQGRDVNLPVGADAAAWASIERRIAALEATTRDNGLRNTSTLSARGSNNDEVLKVVRELLAQSETRQKGELALRIRDVIRDLDLKRAADLNGVRQTVGRIDASVTEEAAAHRELMNYLLKDSKQK